MDDVLIAGVITGVITLIATAIGAYIGGWIIISRQESKNKFPRELLSNFLNTLLKYDSFDKAENDFNNHSIVEKKAVIVALKNLGIPILLDIVDDSYDVDNIKFKNKEVNEDSIKKMIEFVNKGLCDNLFFKEIGSEFYNVPPKIIFARNLALKFLDALKSRSPDAKFQDVYEAAGMNHNQFEVIQVFVYTVNVQDGNTISKNKISEAKNNVKSGVFDHLFYWDYRLFNNLNSQQNLANLLANQALNSQPKDIVANEPVAKPLP